MHSPTESSRTSKVSFSRRADALSVWNRKLHYYLGLLTLLYVWLFAFTGLLLNHSQWQFAEFWSNRRQTSYEHAIVAPVPGSDLVQARDLLRQLGIQGEIEWTVTRSDSSRFDFRVSRPGHIFEVKADLAQNRAAVQRIDLNLWGVGRLLHSFTGVKLDDPRNDRDWWVTTAWATAMDAVAAGLILMVLTSLHMWKELGKKRLWGAIVFAAGALCCVLFCVGLRWLY